MAERQFDCPACGEPTNESDFVEGDCSACHEAAHQRLLLHLAEHDRWERLTDRQRTQEIKAAIRRA